MTDLTFRRRLILLLGTPWACVVVAALLWSAVIGERLKDHHWRISSFIVAGSTFVDEARLVAPIEFNVNSGGYDGQFYYRLALDPFTGEREAYGIRLDTPAYRHQRIGYPLLVWLASFGKPSLVAPMMVVVNILALLVIAWIGGWLAIRFEVHPLWGIILPLHAGFLFTFFRDLTEIVEAMFLLGTIALLVAGKRLLAAASLSGAVLTKETAVLFAIALGIIWAIDLMRRRTSQVSWFVLAIPAAAFVGWQAFIRWRWGMWAFQGGSSNLGKPFEGIVAFVSRIAPFESHLEREFFRELVGLGLIFLFVVIAIRGSKAALDSKVAWMFYVALVVCLTTAVWVEDWAYMRAIVEMSVLGGVIILGAKRAIRLPATVIWVLMWIHLARGMMTGR